MPDTKVSALTDGTTAEATDRIPVARDAGGGTFNNRYVTPGYIGTTLLGSNTLTGATVAGTALSGVQITGTAGQFSCTAATLAVGLLVTISGTLGGTGSITGYTSPTTYRISVTNGSTTFTLVNASTGAALTTTAGTPTGLTYVVTSPVLNLSQTWNNSNVTFTGLQFNATDTASASASLLADLQVGGSSKFSVTKSGLVDASAQIYCNSNIVARSGTLAFPANMTGFIGGYDGANDRAFFFSGVIASNTVTSRKTMLFDATRLVLDNETFTPSIQFSITNPAFISKPTAAATLQLGAADVASGAVAQTLQVQSNTGAGTTGPNFTIKGSAGTTAGGSIIFQTAATTSYATALTIDSTKGATFTAQVMATRYGFSSLTAGPGISYITNDLLLLDGSNVNNGGARLLNNSGFVFRSAYYLGWSDAGVESGVYDTRLYRDAANTLALRNGTSPQLFRVYSTYTDAATNAFGGIGAAKNLDGTSGDANTLYIGSQKTGAPTALTKLAIQVDGTTQLDYNSSASSTWNFANVLRVREGTTGGYVQLNGTTVGTNSGFIGWHNSSGTRIGYMGYSDPDVELTLAGGVFKVTNGALFLNDQNLQVGTTIGTKIGTSTSQKISFWNKSPIVQPTNAIAEATFVENSGGTAVNVDSTFGGYTLQQVVQALQNMGILA